MNDFSALPQETEEQRRFRRRPVLWKGHVVAARHRFDCLVRNITPAGMLVELELTLATGVEVQVELPDTRPLAATVAWSSGRLHGLSFAEPEEAVRTAFGTRAEALGFGMPQATQP